jgi:hypothetical protein
VFQLLCGLIYFLDVPDEKSVVCLGLEQNMMAGLVAVKDIVVDIAVADTVAENGTLIACRGTIEGLDMDSLLGMVIQDDRLMVKS